MTASPADNAAHLWSVPECPFQVEASARVLDDIRLAVVDAFYSLPRGGAEIGGILLGSFQSGRLAITGHAALECEHAFGPSFALSPADEARLKTLLAAHAGSGTGVRPVGWYHSHTRSEIFLSDADLQIHQRYFPETWQVALVIKPHTFQPARIGFFFQAADGSMQTKASCREVTLEALPVRQVPSGGPTASAPDQSPFRRWHTEPEPVPAESAEPAPILAAPPEPEPVPTPEIELPAPQFLPAEAPSSRRWIWILAIGVFLGVGAAGFQTRQAWLPKVITAVKPAPAPPAPPPNLGLNTVDRDGQLQILWDRSSPILTEARDAILEITDGTSSQAIPLDAAHLQTGSFTYARQSEKVDLKLTVHPPAGADIREVSSFLGPLPERKPAEDLEIQKQREELAKQSAQLKLDLNWQMLKTKKLEKDLESIREELKQQQLKRLNNQLPDK